MSSTPMPLFEYYKLSDERRWAQFIDDLLEAQSGNERFFINDRDEPWLYGRLRELLKNKTIVHHLSQISAFRHRLQIVVDNSSGERHHRLGDTLITEINAFVSALVMYYCGLNKVDLFQE